MTTKLNQIIAVEPTRKNQAAQEVTKIYHTVQKGAPFTGIARTYTPKDEDGETLPAEGTKVQVRAKEIVEQVVEAWEKWMNVAAIKDYSNCEARADVVVNGTILAPAVPVSHLLFLEKRITDMRTFISKLPVLDQAENWHWDEASASWVTDEIQTNKSKKVMRNHVRAEATDKHPAQVDVYTEDIVVGTWSTKKFSGALPLTVVQQMLTNVDELLEAVKFAREQANSMETTDLDVATPLLNFVFAPALV